MQLDQPLSEKEFNELDQFLLSDRSSDDAMTMDTLHGYLTAIAIGPETIMPAEWLLKVWGEDEQAIPKWKNAKEEEKIVNLIMRFMNEVLVTFEVAPKEFEPLFVEHEHAGAARGDQGDGIARERGDGAGEDGVRADRKSVV